MASKSNIPQRLIWAVDTLNVQENDRILEIGCGSGVAAGLILPHLQSGRLTALDRSLAAVASTRTRHTPEVESGRLTVVHGELRDTDFGPVRFNKVFAVNVNVFWIGPSAELSVIRRHLTGTLYLFYEPPSQERSDHIVAQVQEYLRVQEFTLLDVRWSESRKTVGVIARL